MAEITPETVAERLERGDDRRLADVRDSESLTKWYGSESEPVDVHDELKADPDAALESLDAPSEDEGTTELELGPNRCAAE